jgi:hypothetical protein
MPKVAAEIPEVGRLKACQTAKQMYHIVLRCICALEAQINTDANGMLSSGSPLSRRA